MKGWRDYLRKIADPANGDAVEQPGNGDDTLRLGSLLLSNDEAVQHFLLTGATGSGKTTLMRLLMQDVVPHIKPGSDTRALVYDPKQEMVSTLRGIRRDVPLVITDPFDARGASWDMATDVREPRVAIEIAFTLIPREKESQPFFSDAARHLIYGVMISFIKRGLPWSLGDVLRAVASPKLLRRVLKANPYSHTLIARYFYDQRLLSNILSTLATRMLPFEPIAACWDSAPTKFSLENWVKSESALVLASCDTSRHAIDSINRCIVKRCIDLLLSQSESITRRTWFFLDELSEAGRLDGLSSLLKKGRSKGGCAVLAFQSIAGLRDSQLYGPRMTAEILGQVGHRVIGRLECPETAEWASQLIGEQEVRQETVSRSYTARENTRTTNEQIVTRRAVLPSEFMSVAPCDAINGLTAYYLSRVTGAFCSTIGGEELFDQSLIPKAVNEPDVIPRAIDCQDLNPWNLASATAFAPPIAKRVEAHKRKKQQKPEQKPVDCDLDVLDGLDQL